MIVKMKKITLLCLAARKDQTVEALQDMGVLHVVTLRTPGGDQLNDARERIREVQTAERILTAEIDEHGERSKGDQAKKKPGDVIKEVLALEEQRRQLTDTIAELRDEYDRIKPFGEFDPGVIKRLAHKGIEVRLYRTSVKKPPEAPEGTVLSVIHRDSTTIYFTLAGAAAAFESELPYARYRVPDFSRGRLLELIESRSRMREDITHKLRQLVHYLDTIQKEEQRLSNYVELLEVREGMETSEKVAILQGYCPVTLMDSLTRAAEDNGWGIVSEDPDPDEKVPTLVYYPRIVRPIKAVFNMLQILPGYREADISGAFLVFFSLFFAMLIGDAGYGALFLLATLIARAKMPKAPSYPFILLGILSIGTITWGVITGNYFGITNLPAPLSGLKIEWLNDRQHVMKLCFFIGAVHLSLAHLWNAVERFPDTRAFAQGGWICLTWVMFYTAGTMVLQEPFPGWVFYLLGVGMALIVIFMTPFKELKKAWIHHAMLPLDVVSNFVDVISYIRLFAVGMATLSVASSFNDMALAAGFGNVLTGLIAALILLLGHGLNILLCGLGILVHGVRLNTLEFSLHKEMQWSGFPYKPFSRREHTSG